MLTQAEIVREAAATGFQVETLEKVLRLLELLESLRSHPFLKERVALKGGTALNLFFFEVPRLSVDVDLNYVGAADRETMLLERPRVDQAVEAVSGRLGLGIKRVPTEHAGGKWRLSYATTSGRPGTLELDLNFLLRTPLWPCSLVDSRPIGSFIATKVPVLDLHELAGGKLAALFARNASRDLFDARNLLRQAELDRARLRLAFVVYGGANRKDWRRITLEDVRLDTKEVERQLLPMLRTELAPDRAEVRRWTEQLVGECRDLLSCVLPLEPHEFEFLTALNDHGDIAAERLTGDAEMQSTIRLHPGLQWKAQNAREHAKRKR